MLNNFIGAIMLCQRRVRESEQLQLLQEERVEMLVKKSLYAEFKDNAGLIDVLRLGEARVWYTSPWGSFCHRGFVRPMTFGKRRQRGTVQSRMQGTSICT